MAVLQDANGDYLIENHTISIALSIQVLDLTQQQGEPDGNQTEVLIVGDSDMPTIWDAQTKQLGEIKRRMGQRSVTHADVGLKYETQPTNN